MSEQVNLANARLLEEYKKTLEAELKQKEQTRSPRTDAERLNQFKDQMLSDMKNLIKQELALMPTGNDSTARRRKPR